MVNGSGLAIFREFQALALFRSHLQLKIDKLVFTYYEDIYRYPVTHLFNTVYVGLPDDRKALSPVNGTTVNMLALVLVVTSTAQVYTEIVV